MNGRHRDDSHGGYEKGLSAQDVVRKVLEAEGIKITKTNQRTDRQGIDYVFFHRNREFKAAVSGTFNPIVAPNYCRFIYSGYKTKVIPGVKYSDVDIFFSFNRAHSNNLYFISKQKIMAYVDSTYGKYLQNDDFCDSIEQSVITGKPQLRKRSTVDFRTNDFLQDIWILVPLREMNFVVRSPKTYSGMCDDASNDN